MWTQVKSLFATGAWLAYWPYVVGAIGALATILAGARPGLRLLRRVGGVLLAVARLPGRVLGRVLPSRDGIPREFMGGPSTADAAKPGTPEHAALEILALVKNQIPRARKFTSAESELIVSGLAAIQEGVAEIRRQQYVEGAGPKDEVRRRLEAALAHVETLDAASVALDEARRGAREEIRGLWKLLLGEVSLLEREKPRLAAVPAPASEPSPAPETAAEPSEAAPPADPPVVV